MGWGVFDPIAANLHPKGFESRSGRLLCFVSNTVTCACCFIWASASWPRWDDRWTARPPYDREPDPHGIHDVVLMLRRMQLHCRGIAASVCLSLIDADTQALELLPGLLDKASARQQSTLSGWSSRSDTRDRAHWLLQCPQNAGRALAIQSSSLHRKICLKG